MAESSKMKEMPVNKLRDFFWNNFSFRCMKSYYRQPDVRFILQSDR